jgi:hypothetical protein
MFGDLAMDDADEFELDIHDEAQPSFGPLDPFMASSNATLGGQLKKLGEGIKGVKYSMRFLKESRDRSPQIGKLISQVEAMYEHVQESVSDPRKKNEYELTLEAFYKELNQLQEQNMRNNRLRRLHEKKLAFSLEIPGLGDDVSLDDVTIEITPEDGEEGEDMGDEDMEMDLDDEGGDEGEGEDMGDEDMDLDLGGDEEEEEPKEESQDYSKMESRRLKDNLVVEIDEGMLRREISRMKVIRESRNRRARRLAEEAVPSTKGHGPGDMNDFGGDVDDEGEPLDLKFRKEDVAESRRHARNDARRNDASNRPAVQAESILRAKLAESNLFNAKLIYTNKLLQNESLSKRQKAEIIERLDEARTLREVKLVYESLTKTLAGTSRPLSESRDRKVLGSSSRATRPASTNLNEGFETDRWARLAGITK